MVVAQLVERLLPTPEIHGSSPAIGKILFTINWIKNCIEKMKIKKKRQGMAHIKHFKSIHIEKYSQKTSINLPKLLRGMSLRPRIVCCMNKYRRWNNNLKHLFTSEQRVVVLCCSFSLKSSMFLVKVFSLFVVLLKERRKVKLDKWMESLLQSVTTELLSNRSHRIAS